MKNYSYVSAYVGRHEKGMSKRNAVNSTFISFLSARLEASAALNTYSSTVQYDEWNPVTVWK